MAEHSQFQLLRERRFAPFFWTQFLGAGNDNVYKNALVIFVAFQAAALTAISSNALVNIAAAVFIAPFMIFSATAGQLADKYEKSRLIRLVKLFEIAIMADGPLYAGATTIAIAIAGYLVSRRVPPAPAVAPDPRINWNPFTETWRNLRFAQGNRVVWLSMLGISWFWFYGATYLTQFANFTREVIGGDEHVATMMLAIFSVGIGAGSLLCERLSGHKVEVGLVPFGSIGLSVFAIDLYFARRGLAPDSLTGVDGFLRVATHWRIVADLILLGMFGGFYIVPLYALIQERSDPAFRSRIIAANNILNALFMVASAAIALGLLKAGCPIPQLFLATGLMNALVALYIYLLMPEFTMRFLAWLLVHTIYRVPKEGLDRIPAKGGCVIVCNRVSFVDAVVIAACVRRAVRFVMDHRSFQIPVLIFRFGTMRARPYDPVYRVLCVEG